MASKIILSGALRSRTNLPGYAAKEIKKGIVLGIYQSDKKNEFQLSPDAANYCSDGLIEKISSSGPVLKEGSCRIVHDDSVRVALVGLGKSNAEPNPIEERDEARESVRIAVAAGVRALKGTYTDVTEILVDPCGDAEAAGEGSILCQWKYDELKSKKSEDDSPVDVKVACLNEDEAWDKGSIKARAQNLARTLMETPANYMTPTIFSERIRQEYSNLPIDVKVHDKSWAEKMKMGSFLSVSAGSAEPPKFLELTYRGEGSGELPVILVGKGVTFDSGGISLKPSKGMDSMRADMGGAACVVSTLYAVASLKLPVNLKVLVPLCENMPGGKATKPGDVVTAMNGKTIQVDNTDAEGRLILADALCYADTFKPTAVLDVATLTGAMAVALGAGAAGVFTNSDRLWPQLHKAGYNTGDRLWRMPLWKLYSKQIGESPLADLNNIGSKGYGGACTAAAFLKEFTTSPNWFHLDIAGVMENSDEVPYLGKGMSGRPTRTLIEFIQRLKNDL